MCSFLGGVCDLCSETRGGLYFAAEGREIEGPPPRDVFGSFPKDPLTRKANEAVTIKNTEKSALLNSKSEFNHPPIARISVEKKTKKFEEKSATCWGEQVWHISNTGNGCSNTGAVSRFMTDGFILVQKTYPYLKRLFKCSV